ncbi:MAG: hypothetical protein V4678_02890 [Patescibacteria group bacterium]
MSLKKNSIRKPIIGLAAVAALGLAVFGVGSTGADFSASDTGNVSIQSGTLTVELSDANNVGSFQLSYPNLAPGEIKADQFTVKNTGSIPADVEIGAPFSNVNANLGSANPAKLTVGVDNYKPMAVVTTMTGNVALGSLNPGESRTYTVRVGLDQSAGNEWQGKSLSTDVTVALKQ